MCGTTDNIEGTAFYFLFFHVQGKNPLNHPDLTTTSPWSFL